MVYGGVLLFLELDAGASLLYGYYSMTSVSDLG